MAAKRAAAGGRNDPPRVVSSVLPVVDAAAARLARHATGLVAAQLRRRTRPHHPRRSRRDGMSAAEKLPVWLTEQEAADYCRCCLKSFRRMQLPASNSGGRKVYNRASL